MSKRTPPAGFRDTGGWVPIGLGSKYYGHYHREIECEACDKKIGSNGFAVTSHRRTCSAAPKLPTCPNCSGTVPA